MKLAFSHDFGETFSYTTIYEDDAIYSYKNQPIITVTESGEIRIYFAAEEGDVEGSIFAFSTDDGISFQNNFWPTGNSNYHAGFNYDNVQNRVYSTSQRNKITQYQYFTDTEESENADGDTFAGITKFWGQDVLHGPVHSNGDIWIQQAGGGNNNGWPIFYGKVTTAGHFRKFPSGGQLTCAEMECVFMGGYEDEVLPIELDSSFDEIMENGVQISVSDITYIEIDGSGYTGYAGEIVLVLVEDFDVYSWYPSDAEQAESIIDAGGNWFEDSDIIWTNHIPIYDTLWAPISGAVDSLVWVSGDLYISGEVAGLQVWACTGDAYLVDDITYSSTCVGDSPDGFSGYNEYGIPEYNDQINQVDYFTLVSQQKIKVAYKFRHPETGEILDGNLDDHGIYLYGSFMAIGLGDYDIYGEQACHYDGTFSFDYQHPHGSTPSFFAPSPYSGNDTLYSYVDFHKYIFPFDSFLPPEVMGFQLHGNGPGSIYPAGMCGFPWDSSTQPDAYAFSFPNNAPNYLFPDGTDYPWINPVWPESAADIVTYQAGRAIEVFGSIIQRRRGFIHRSGSDPYTHPNQTEWDLDEFHYSGTHPETGFDKEYHYDARLNYYEPYGLDSLIQGGEDSLHTNVYNFYSENNSSNAFERLISRTATAEEPIILADQDENRLVVCVEVIAGFGRYYRLIISETNGETFDLFAAIFTPDIISKIQLNENNLYFLHKPEQGLASDLFTLSKIDLDNGEQTEISIFEGSALAASLNDNVLVISNQPDLMEFYENFQPNNLSQYSWTTPFSYDLEQIAFVKSENSVHLFCKATGAVPNVQAITYYINGDWEDIMFITEDEISELEYQLRNYPNPFNLSGTNRSIGTTIEFSIPEKEISGASIEIFNVKGQLVKQIEIEIESKINSVVWNGKDKNNKIVSSGVYMYRLNIDDETILDKKMLLIK